MNSTANAIFSPGSNTALVNIGLLAMRVWFAGGMMMLHGWDKLANFSSQRDSAGYGVLGLPPVAGLSLAVFAEFICAGLLLIGLLSRFASLMLAITMAVAFVIVHEGALSGSGSGEMAALYLGAFAVLTATGPGKLSVDAALFNSKPAMH
jgi:putative oxidoreductase